MKITPLEIRQKSFEKAFRGINKEEVNAFLLSLSHEWERMLDENKDLKGTISKLEQEVQKLREVESTLFRTLKTAEETGASVVEQANKTAELHMKETQINVDAMVNDAKNQARAIIDKAESQAKEVIEEMNNEVKGLEEDYRIIENQRDNVISQLKMLSGDVMNKVEKIKYQESNGIEVHLKKVKQMLRDTTEKVENKAEEIDFDKLETPQIHIPKAESNQKLSSEKKNVSATSQSKPVQSTQSEMSFSREDSAKVKKNMISESHPISRNPAPHPSRIAPKISEGDSSFFDSLED
ncbi:DivIVA domain-containing protein [Reichenbachiella versicolor]|uniref:DivIVA domain-containing protein n=1 Tax=Reichenbachiella versicolor TaxID=1821036 RepID=UPI000D6DFE3B|nr:DivIVA domain-containing protein [Reichenbachiella versicolor]